MGCQDSLVFNFIQRNVYQEVKTVQSHKARGYIAKQIYNNSYISDNSVRLTVIKYLRELRIHKQCHVFVAIHTVLPHCPTKATYIFTRNQTWSYINYLLISKFIN
jgi:hypothetical protein